MSTEGKTPVRRGTPISDGLGADLHTLGTLLANHTRGIDAYLSRQAERIEERQNNLLAESAELLLPPGLDFDALTTAELQDICRRQRFKRWSKLRRADLIAFLQQELGTEFLVQGESEDEPRARSAPAGVESQAPLAFPSDASRSERLLLLLLSKLGVGDEELDAAWQGPL